jgi:hypothetical protein
VAGLLLFIVAPVIIRGGLLADEYIICLRPIHEGGYGQYLQAIWQDTGVARPARFIELFLISKTCTWAPYGLVMLVPLALKFAAGLLLYGLLRDLRVAAPWPEIGTALWLLEPLGTEAAERRIAPYSARSRPSKKDWANASAIPLGFGVSWSRRGHSHERPILTGHGRSRPPWVYCCRLLPS